MAAVTYASVAATISSFAVYIRTRVIVAAVFAAAPSQADESADNNHRVAPLGAFRLADIAALAAAAATTRSCHATRRERFYATRRKQVYAWAGVLPIEAEGGIEAVLMLTAEQRPMRVSIVLLAVHTMEGNGARDVQCDLQKGAVARRRAERASAHRRAVRIHKRCGQPRRLPQRWDGRCHRRALRCHSPSYHAVDVVIVTYACCASPNCRH
mmetsp:Transcript_32890/g.63319  ORF Transcript_32890/g.63319 Transcript_32890/m.63319 type:complete len:212 (+) Transcript_32890:953-1588(+)